MRQHGLRVARRTANKTPQMRRHVSVQLGMTFNCLAIMVRLSLANWLGTALQQKAVCRTQTTGCNASLPENPTAKRSGSDTVKSKEKKVFFRPTEEHESY